MKMTKRQFSLQYGIEVQWVSTLCEKGAIPYEKQGNSKIPRVMIDDSCLDDLVEGIHFVECPVCHKKMAALSRKHMTLHPGVNIPVRYSELYLKDHKKTEADKVRQSKTLRERFQTPEGEITRKIIGEASKKLNADPEYKSLQRKKFKEAQNRPEMKEAQSKRSLERWASSSFREKMHTYVEENLEQLKESARRARSYQKRQSNLHIAYKEQMLEAGLEHFISEYEMGPYKIDEADPMAKIAIEIDGCFWHGCQLCGYDGDPKMRATDKKKDSFLKNRGWMVLRIKEHELKKNPQVAIEMIRNIQAKRRGININKIKESFHKGSLKVRSKVDGEMKWVPMSDVLRHQSDHKRMFEVKTEIGSVVVTEDHSLFDSEDNPIPASDIKAGDLIVGLPGKEFESIKVISCAETDPEKYSYDISVPRAENFVLESGILAHNSYSISGVSLDIEKSSKYQAMKDEYMNQYDKLVEAAKRSIKIIVGLRQFRYGIGITSALGPLSRPGVQSRRNWISSGAPSWS